MLEFIVSFFVVKKIKWKSSSLQNEVIYFLLFFFMASGIFNYVYVMNLTMGGMDKYVQRLLTVEENTTSINVEIFVPMFLVPTLSSILLLTDTVPSPLETLYKHPIKEAFIDEKVCGYRHRKLGDYLTNFARAGFLRRDPVDLSLFISVFTKNLHFLRENINKNTLLVNENEKYIELCKHYSNPKYLYIKLGTFYNLYLGQLSSNASEEDKLIISKERKRLHNDICQSDVFKDYSFISAKKIYLNFCKKK